MLSYAKKLVNEINIWSKFCKSVQWECVSQWAEEGDTKNRKTHQYINNAYFGWQDNGTRMIFTFIFEFSCFQNFYTKTFLCITCIKSS